MKPLKDKLPYNLQAAIEMRGKTLAELNLTECLDATEIVVDFKLSLEITDNRAPNYFDWGNLPEWVCIMHAYGVQTVKRDLTRDQWKEIDHEVRDHNRRMNQSEDEPEGPDPETKYYAAAATYHERHSISDQDEW